MLTSKHALADLAGIRSASITRPLRTSYRREKRASRTELPSSGAPKVALASSVFGKRAVEPSIANRRKPCPQPGGEVAFEAFQQWVG